MYDYEEQDKWVRRMLDRVNIPKQYRGLTFADLDPYEGDALEQAQRWVQAVVDGKVIEAYGKLSGVGLLLHGEPGHGKTTLAATALQELLLATRPASWGESRQKPYQPSRGAYMVYYRDVFNLLHKNMSDRTTEEEKDLLEDLTGSRFNETTIRVLFLDDVGKEHRTASGWASGYFEEVIRTRFYHSWPTIITTNMGPSEWESAYGASAADFMQEAFMSVSVTSGTGSRR